MKTSRLKRESRTMAAMVQIYCGDWHEDRLQHPCEACQAFLAYADQRLEKCPYGADKPTCANCPIHCYKPARREQAQAIMRHAGPRMLLRHPWLALRHLLDGRRRVEHPMAERRRRLAEP
ncbi:MAG TPA: nitrous oxide-stimulated promoter family protein [Steroidobacteraceae bacterium]|nr:nitrous oxide-stimulated promoter family protein [Steroidobacteraceae bacterium]